MSLSTLSGRSHTVSLATLPDDILQAVFEFLTTFEILESLVHRPPCKAWIKLWHHLPSCDIDLERDIGELLQRNDDAKQVPIDPQARSIDVARLITRKRSHYSQLLRLIALNSRELLSLNFDNFGAALSDEIPAADGSSAIKFKQFLSNHTGSLMSLSLINSGISSLELGSEFVQLESINLNKCKGLTTIAFKTPTLTSLDLSRTLTNDFEMLKLFPNLPRLKHLALVGCKNIRKVEGETPEKLFGPLGSVPGLRVLDLSNTGIIDVSVRALAEHCQSLESLFLADCSQLRAPQICSQSLITLSLRGCTRLRHFMRIDCPNLKELDMSKSNVKDSMINSESLPAGVRGAADPQDQPSAGQEAEVRSGMLNIPNIEVLMLTNCYELFTPMFQNTVTPNSQAASEAASNLVSPSSSTSSSSTSSYSSMSTSPKHHNPSIDALQSYPHLHTIDMSMSYGLQNSAVFHLLQMAPNVKYVNFGMCKEITSPWKPDGANGESRVEVFPSNLVQLRELNVRMCTLTDESLALLMASPSASKLSVLNLRNCNQITGRGIRGLHLVELDLRLTLLTDEILPGLLTACPNLRRLFVGQCDKLINSTVKHSLIEELEVSGSKHIHGLIVECPQLRYLNIAMNRALYNVEVSKCSSLERVDMQHSPRAVLVEPLPSQALHIISNTAVSVRATDIVHDSLAVADSLAVHRPLNAYSAGAYREYQQEHAQIVQQQQSQPIPNTGSLDDDEVRDSVIATNGKFGSPPRVSHVLTNAVQRSSPKRMPVSSPIQYNAYDSAPLSTSSSIVTGRHGNQSHAYPLPYPPLTKPRQTPPPSPGKEARKSPASSPASSSSSSTASTASISPSSSSSSSSSSYSSSISTLGSSPPRGIRSMDLCILEERIRELETDLVLETEALKRLPQGDPTESDQKLTVYGLKKQLAVQKAKLVRLKRTQKEEAIKQAEEASPSSTPINGSV